MAMAVLSASSFASATEYYKITTLSPTQTNLPSNASIIPTGLSFQNPNLLTEIGASNFNDQAGDVFGFASMYDSSGNGVATVAWYYGAQMSAPLLIGLYDSAHTGYSTIYSDSWVSETAKGSTHTMSANGYVVSQAARSITTTGGGTDIWMFNPTTLQTLQIPAPASDGTANYSYNNANGTYQLFNYGGVDNSGNVFGYVNRLSSSNGSLGNDVFFYNASTNSSTVINPTTSSADPLYNFTGGTSAAATLGTRAAATSYMAGDGVSLGASSHYFSNGTVIPSAVVGGTFTTAYDYWFYNPAAASGSQLQFIGLYDSPAATSNDPVAIGHVNRTGTNNGVNYQTALSFVNALNQTVGYSARFDSNGTIQGKDAWIATAGGSTVAIGLSVGTANGTLYQAANGTANSNYTSSALVSLTNSGITIGTTNRYSSTGAALGYDGWMYLSQSAGTPTIGIALSGAVPNQTSGYTYDQTVGTATSHTTTPILVSEGGTVAGISLRYNASGTAIGQDAWSYTPPANATSVAYTPANPVIQLPTVIGLTGDTLHTSPGGSTTLGTSSSNVTFINASGEIAGESVRYNPTTGATSGQDAWIAINGVTIPVVPTTIAPSSGSSYFFSQITYIAANGAAVGWYTTSTAGTAFGSYYPDIAFEWIPTSATTGAFQILQPVTDPTSVNWQDLYRTPNSSQIQGQVPWITTSGQIIGVGSLVGDSAFSGADSATAFKLTQLTLGDANEDGKVDLSDLNIVLNNLGSTTSLWTMGNFDKAATIDLTDLNDVLNNLGVSTVSGSSIAAAPEPTSLSLLGLAGLLLTRRRRSR